MKKAAVISGGILIIFTLAVAGIVIYTASNQKPLGIADRTDNINMMLASPDNWEKIAAEAIISEAEMAIIDGSTATIPITAELFRQFFGYSDRQIEESRIVLHSTTHSAYMHLIDRADKASWYYGYEEYGEYKEANELYPVSLIFVTAPSEEETEYARSKGVELDMKPVAKDGFVFITHTDNPVDSLTVEQIRDIYAGRITNWREVGGKDLEIRAYQRNPNSGSQTAMEQMVMQGIQMRSPETVLVDMWFGMGALVEAVAEYENGPASIGYSYYFYLNNLYRNENIKVLNIDGISPANENLTSGAYPFATHYYAVIRGDEPEDSPARKLRDYLISPEGQRIIEMAGYCRAVN
jgi:phosphate transport system substrate-binding protein